MCGSHTFIPGVHKVELRNPASLPLTIGNGLELKYCPHLGPDQLGCFSTRKLKAGEWTYFEGMLCTGHGQLIPELWSHAITCAGIGADRQGRGSTLVLGVRSAVRPASLTAEQWMKHLNTAADGLGAASFVNSALECNAGRPPAGSMARDTDATFKLGGAVYHTVDRCMEPTAGNLLPLRLSRDVERGHEVLWDYPVRMGVTAPRQVPSPRQRKRARAAHNRKRRAADDGPGGGPDGCAPHTAEPEGSPGEGAGGGGMRPGAMSASYRRRQSKKKGKRLAAADAAIPPGPNVLCTTGCACPACGLGVGATRTNCIRCQSSYHPDCLAFPGLEVYMCARCSCVAGPIENTSHAVSFTEIMSGISTGAMALCEMRNQQTFYEIKHLESVEIDKACELLCSELDEWRPPGRGNQPYKGMAPVCRTHYDFTVVDTMQILPADILFATLDCSAVSRENNATESKDFMHPEKFNVLYSSASRSTVRSSSGY